MSFWDIAQFVAPIAATAIGGPVAGIAVGGLMSGGGSLAKGEDWRTALLKGGLGAGSGALGAGMAGGLSKAAANAGTRAASKAASKAGEELLKSSVSSGVMGIPAFSQEAIGKAVDLTAKGAAKQAAFTKFSDVFSKGLGKNPDETGAMLKTVAGGANTLGQIASLFGPDEDPRFSSIQGLMNGPGMSPMYQYGTGGGGRRTTIFGTGRYY